MLSICPGIIPRGSYWEMGGPLKLSERSLDYCGVCSQEKCRTPACSSSSVLFFFLDKVNLGLLTLHESKAIIHLIVDKDDSKIVIKMKLFS